MGYREQGDAGLGACRGGLGLWLGLLLQGRRLGLIRGGAGLGACRGGLGLLPRGRRLGRILLKRCQKLRLAGQRNGCKNFFINLHFFTRLCRSSSARQAQGKCCYPREIFFL